MAQTTFDATTWRHSGAALLDPVASLDVLRHACVPSGWSLQEVQEAELIHERPGRRRTVLYRVLAGRGPEPAREAWWFGKQYASKKGARVRALLDVLQGRSFHPSETSNAYAVPDPIGYAPRVRLLVTARLEGPSLQSLVERGSAVEPLLERTGIAMARMHEALCSEGPFHALRDCVDVRAHGPGAEAAILDEACHRVAASGLPATRVREFKGAAAAVRGALLVDHSLEPPCLLHRDLHPGQIVLGEPVGFLDWDDAAWGDAELDLGNLEAHLILSDCHSRRPRQRAYRLGEALRAGYRSCRRFDDARQNLYVASSLLRLASLERLADRQLSELSWVDLSGVLLEETHCRIG